MSMTLTQVYYPCFVLASSETNMQYNYNYGDGGVVDETSANFKNLSDERKALKKDAVSE